MSESSLVRGKGSPPHFAPLARFASAAGELAIPQLHGAISGRLTQLAPSLEWASARLLVVLFSFLPYLLIGETWLLAGFLLERIADPAASMPALEGVASIPRRLLLFHALFVGVIWLPRRWQTIAAAIGALGTALATGLIGLPSMLALALFAGAFFLLFKSPLPRAAMLGAILLTIPLLRTLGDWFALEAIARSGLSIGLLVALWYACYRLTTGKTFAFHHYLAYVKTRLFMEGPVLTVQDFTPEERERELERTRLAGVASLAVAMLARSVSHELGLWLEGGALREARGIGLVGWSYVFYLHLALGIVAGYNMWLGLLRLFGLPVRSNFGLWIFARTPNEHWQRWNLLFREWLITFTFYPLMRARRPLFVAIMATLLASGALHVWASLTLAAPDLERLGLTMTYWTLNGLAIYLVLALPRRAPRLCERLRLGQHPAWWPVGWALTSAFYALLYALFHGSETFEDARDTLARLVGA